MLVLNAAHSTLRVVGKARHDRRPALQHARARQASGWWPAEMVWLIAASKDALLRFEDFRTRAPGS
jgi:hypothetical protein